MQTHWAKEYLKFSLLCKLMGDEAVFVICFDILLCKLKSEVRRGGTAREFCYVNFARKQICQLAPVTGFTNPR